MVNRLIGVLPLSTQKKGRSVCIPVMPLNTRDGIPPVNSNYDVDHHSYIKVNLRENNVLSPRYPR